MTFFSLLRLLMATSRLYGRFFMTCAEETYLRYSMGMGGKTQGLIPVLVPSPYRRVDRKVRFALFVLVQLVHRSAVRQSIGLVDRI